ncbi:Beta-1,4-mannosyl-glycoprotein 4-beta-N-acetylglucosaminyltransferase [Grifola frondosa]|uniref:Beta-1,4-mannosyl-glycoprotein 4-beta-N-acetylglucosaminyltransferase n=1 Tax=Grifola frondosa TaxID=5627 RepID=A0A1C7LJJ1_GRIFR|nr:Beta-1,4-mannosyl-glycoprotein 4-beta-N-acetylglucosaminyltransferase [Grifola frondosa]
MLPLFHYGTLRPQLLLAVLLFLAFHATRHSLQIHNFISYSTRPLWDRPLGPADVLPHYYAEGIHYDTHICELHGWKPRDERPDVWDAVLFSTELDLLEIRMHELDSVVSKFFIVESDLTFTGLPKNLTFAENGGRFATFEHKIIYSVFHARQLEPDESPFVNEIAQRQHMDSLLRDYKDPSRPPPLVIFSDVDEIPYAHTMRLLQYCEAPSPIHLQMREYIYSFEWPAGEGSWRAQVHRWDLMSDGYGHSQVAGVKLANAGWHCSFCFRYIEEFVNKMRGYSHADRVTDLSLLDPDRIQRVICEGSDIFGMLPEAYRYKDLLTLMDKDPTLSAVHIPRYLIENSEKFRFLLPGGCFRERSSSI